METAEIQIQLVACKFNRLPDREELASNGGQLRLSKNCYRISVKFTGCSFSDGVTGHGFQTHVMLLQGVISPLEGEEDDGDSILYYSYAVLYV